MTPLSAKHKEAKAARLQWIRDHWSEVRGMDVQHLAERLKDAGLYAAQTHWRQHRCAVADIYKQVEREEADESEQT